MFNCLHCSFTTVSCFCSEISLHIYLSIQICTQSFSVSSVTLSISSRGPTTCGTGAENNRKHRSASHFSKTGSALRVPIVAKPNPLHFCFPFAQHAFRKAMHPTDCFTGAMPGRSLASAACGSVHVKVPDFANLRYITGKYSRADE